VAAAVPELDLAKITKFCEERVPAKFREQIRVEADIRGKSVTILECRPPWHENQTDWSRMRVAQLRFSDETMLWTLYWADRNSRWHLYDLINPGTVDELLTEIADDPTCIFWG
jgi:Protein of unknown function (DUF3024)